MEHIENKGTEQKGAHQRHGSAKSPGEDAHQRPAPKAPPKKEPTRRSTAVPRPKGPAPGRTEGRLPDGPEPITTPNLWGPDAAIMKQPSVVEKDLADEDLQKRGFAALPHRTKVAIYIASVIAVLIIFTALIVVFGQTPDLPT